jgi:predicted outer membrane protein
VLPDTIVRPRWTMVLAALTGLTAAAAIWLAVPTRPPFGFTDGWTQTPTGPVGLSDRDMLAALRQTALWEAPVGQQAQQMAVDPSVRQLGATLSTDLGSLSGQVRALADELGVVLPSQPTADQQAWLNAIASASGPGYDRVMVRRLRQGCVETLDVIDQARVATRNNQVRQLADRAGQVLRRHLDALDQLRPAS